MTTYTNDFSSDPSANLTDLGGTGFTYDSGNADLDVTMDGGNPLLRYDSAPGNIEHECQITTVGASRPLGAAVRVHNGATHDGYTLLVDASGYLIYRFNAGTRTTVSSGAITGPVNGDFVTYRGSAEGGDGANVVLRGYFTDHNSTSKPSDPDWIGDVDTPTPDFSATDSSVDRLDDVTVHLYCGVGGRGAPTDYDTQADFLKIQAISDRGGAAASSNLMLLGVT